MHATIAVAALAVCLCPSAMSARTTSELPSSILVFPKVVVDGSRDTFIQISNTANSVVHAHCVYVNAYPECVDQSGDCVLGTCTRCEDRWQELDFNISLTKQQPTHWGVSLGRLQSDGPTCRFNTSEYNCYSAGLPSLGRIPPVASRFRGELRCIEVDQSGAPISGNHLKGEATIISNDGDASKYNAIGILGEPFTNNGDNTLCMGGEPSASCPTGAEYQGCPARYMIPHFSAKADNPVFGPTSQVRTELTVVPCRVNYELASLDLTSVTLQFIATNELEQSFSASHRFQCWDSFFLDVVHPIFSVGVLQTRLVQTMVRPVVRSSGPPSGVMVIGEDHHALETGATARSAYNVHEIGNLDEDSGFVGSELIILPAGP